MTKPRSERIERPFLPATAVGTGLGDFPLGSPQSRAAARSLLEARKATDGDELRFVFRSIVDGSVIKLGKQTESDSQW